VRRLVVVGAVLAVGLLTAGSAAAGDERARRDSEQELPAVYAQGVARAGDRWVLSGMNVLARLTDALEVETSAGSAIPPVLTIAASIYPVYFDHFTVSGPETEPPATDTAASSSDDLDPGWPPVLIFGFIAAAATAIVVGVTFWRRGRAAARGG
jgi:hypothetical protein